eukprot:CAMPEP_0182866164 /NCGR_PEP_ID=MMETSP0034_2-20130328/8068_1 /TAXON_ID=156128 /ORGANISM="Nephroselmis pyriformis, Strain CCMP717" /LENGTH=97 /DNA_ID=CAMNT_0024998491 /DNA_START=75 /DNA_END=365 /DNA_ORIENTATION=+
MAKMASGRIPLASHNTVAAQGGGTRRAWSSSSLCPSPSSDTLLSISDRSALEPSPLSKFSDPTFSNARCDPSPCSSAAGPSTGGSRAGARADGAGPG